MPGEGSAAGPPARAHHALELLRAPHPRLLRQHDPSRKPRAACALRPLLRRRSARGPCGGAPRGQRVQHGYACAHGSRGPWPAGGCSAGTCACSLELQVGSKLKLPHERADMPCAALPGASPDGHDGTADVAWVSLLTVWAILVQVKLSFSRAYHQATPRFPQRSRRRRPRLWKNRHPQIAIQGPAAAEGWGNCAAAHVHTLWTSLWTTSCGHRPTWSARP